MDKIHWSCRQHDDFYIVRAERRHGDIWLGVGIAMTAPIREESALSLPVRIGLIVRLAEIELNKMARLQPLKAAPTLH